MINSSNVSQFSEITLISETEATIFWVIFSIITFVGLLGNFLVILAVLSSESMKMSGMNLLLMNMALADFGNILIGSSDWIQILIFRAPVWNLFGLSCPIVRYSGVMFLFASLLTQVAVCIERYLATRYPLKVRHICSHLYLTFWITMIWLFAAASALPYALLYRKRLAGISWPNGPTMCRTRRPMPIEFKTAECLMFYFLPLCLLVVLYTRISLVLWYDSDYLSDTIRRAGRVAAMARIQGRRRVVKMLVFCVAVYFICYSPIQCLFLSTILFDFYIPTDSFSVVVGLNALCYASSACNPLLYTAFSEKFRARFQQLLHCKTPSSSTKRVTFKSSCGSELSRPWSRPTLQSNSFEMEHVSYRSALKKGQCNLTRDRSDYSVISTRSMPKSSRSFEMEPL